MYPAAVVLYLRSLFKQDHFTFFFTCEITAAMVAIFFNVLIPPRFYALIHESESSGSQQEYRKMFPYGWHCY